MTHAIHLQNISVSYGKKSVLNNISLDLPSSKITAIIGPNGCGKSTLLRTINGLIKPSTGTVKIGNDNITSLNCKKLSQRISFLEQTPSAPSEMQILQLVKLGRYCHQNMLQQWTENDQIIVETAMRQAGVWDLRNRGIANVSGGQLQRAWWAMCLAQDADSLLLDEPINHLDITYQLECLDNIRILNQNHNKTVVMVLHDINLAIRYADYMIAMTANGSIYAQGTPNDIINPDLFASIFDIKVGIIPFDELGGIPVFIPLQRI